MDLSLIKEKLKNYCAFQERCTNDIIEKLYSLKVPSNLHPEIINYLKEYDFLNDHRFLESYINGKINLKKWGAQKIIWHLQKKGFSRNEILQVLNTVNTDSFFKNAKELAEFKLADKKLTIENKGKIYRYLFNKGYNKEMIYEIIRELELRN
jgi:regulatory protein